jgi:hypothetical protein
VRLDASHYRVFAILAGDAALTVIWVPSSVAAIKYFESGVVYLDVMRLRHIGQQRC